LRQPYRFIAALVRGYLESVYETLLGDRLTGNGLRVERQKRVSIKIEGRYFAEAFFRIDLLVQRLRRGGVEVMRSTSPSAHKAVDHLPASYRAGTGFVDQLRRTDAEVGTNGHRQQLRVIFPIAASREFDHTRTRESAQKDPQNPFGTLL
jgi:hypothetical protein